MEETMVRAAAFPRYVNRAFTAMAVLFLALPGGARAAGEIPTPAAVAEATPGPDVFETPPEAYLVPASASSGSLGNRTSGGASLSGDGSRVVFDSDASNLMPFPDNGFTDVFLQDFAADSMTICSQDTLGASADANSFSPSVSGDGRHVAFMSLATDLAPGNPAGRMDIFSRDTQTGLTTLVSASRDGSNQPSSDSKYPVNSQDGRYVAFESSASNLTAGDTNAGRDVFLADLTGGTLTRVSVSAAGGQGNGESLDASISGDGRYVAFDSYAGNLVDGDANGARDVFVKDTLTGAVSLASVSSTGTQGTSESRTPGISADGDHLAFVSYANNLVTPSPGVSVTKVYLRHLSAGETSFGSYSWDGNPNNDVVQRPSLSGDGRFLAFESNATNLVPLDTNGKTDVFLRDTWRGITLRMSLNARGEEGDGHSTLNAAPSLSADGRYLVFLTQATNLAPGDGNGVADVLRVVNPLAEGGPDFAGGPGDDRYILHTAATVRELPDEGIDTLETDLPAAALPENVENLTFTGTGNVTGYGNDLDNVVTRGDGDAVLVGGGGSDTAAYDRATAGVAVDLSLLTAQATGVGTDVLVGFENLRGSPHGDTLTGDAAANVLEGGGGDDTLNGAGGTDTASYAGAPGGVAVNLALTGPQETLSAGRDTLVGFENLHGGPFGDTLTGDAAANVLEGGDGDDTLDGAGGTDTASYAGAPGGVAVNLALTGPQETLSAGRDTLAGFENLRGSPFDDTLAGNAANNLLHGGGGTDTCTGRGGRDTFVLSDLAPDTVTDFTSKSDRVAVTQGTLRVGDGDTKVEGAVSLGGPGGFKPGAELVVITKVIKGKVTPATAARAIGSARSAYKKGATALFAVRNASATVLYRFTSSAADKAVSAAELWPLATLKSRSGTVSADYLFLP
jgi:Tol biopolymer transport system component